MDNNIFNQKEEDQYLIFQDALTTRSMTEWQQEAAKQPKPTPLWSDLMYEREVTCLFADSGVGKSLLAVQMARDIALAGHKVIYIDFELTTQQFSKRYTDPDTNQFYHWPDNLLRCEQSMLLSVNSKTDAEREKEIIGSIERHAQYYEADVVIIDNITWICTGSQDAEMASRLVMRLKELRDLHGWSILVLAHTPKRMAIRGELTQNDLAGSKRLYNFLDAVFAIGESTKGDNIRYIKHLKARSCKPIYPEGSVLECTLSQQGAWTGFTFGTTGPERAHLRSQQEQRIELIDEARELSEQGMSLSAIADRLNVSKATAHRWVQKKEEGQTPNP